MIVKKIRGIDPPGRTAAGRIGHTRRLVDYLRSPKRDPRYAEQIIKYLQEAAIHRKVERFLHIGGLNFVCD
ncbi:MAG: hypothetical protein ACTHOL_19145, partial [Luteibacter jiangsuensis]